MLARPSPSVFQRMVAPLEGRTFLEQHFDRRACLLLSPGRTWSDLLSWDALSTILSSAPVPHPTLRLPSAGRPARPRNATDFLGLLKSGTTVIIEDLDRYHPPIGSFLNAFSRETNENARINMYLTPPRAQGFQKHYDTQDNFILQAEGSKRWRVWPSTIPNPHFYLKQHGTDAPKGEPYLEGVLHAGDVLYIPRGHWHEALTEGESSIHLTLAMFRRNGVEFARWLVDELREDPAVRASFKLHWAIKGETVDQQPPLDFGPLKEALLRALDSPDLSARYLKFATASQRFRPEFSLPAQLTPVQAVMSLTELEVVPMLIFIERDGETLRVIGKEFVLSFPKRAEALIRSILTSQIIRPNELAEVHRDIGSSNIAKVLETLLSHGVLAVSVH